MARKRTSTLDELVTVLARLPWWVSALIAVISWLSLSRVAGEPLVAPDGSTTVELSGMMWGQLWRSSAMIGQYLIPLICLLGTLGSIVGRRRGQKRGPGLTKLAAGGSWRWRSRRHHASVGSSSQTQTPSGAPPEVTCPLCGAAMVRRVTMRGANAGTPFWGCSRYPGCKGVLDNVGGDIDRP